MNLNRLRTAVCAGALLAGAAIGWAGPLQRADVPAEPAWLVHLDCDGLRPTAIGQYLLAQINKPENQARLAAFEAMFNLDLRKHLHGLTVYSTGLRPEDGVLVAYADFDPERLTTLAKAANDSRHTRYKEHVIYNWCDDKKKTKTGEPQRTYAAIAGGRVVFGQSQEPVAHALDVLDHAVPNLAQAKTFPQLGASGDRSFLEAAARKLDLPAGDPSAAILKLSKLVRLQLSEVEHQVSGTLTLEANDAEVAGQMASVAKGLVALLKLQPGKPEAAQLAQALAFKQEGASVLVNLAMPASQAVALLQADAARKAKQ